MLRHDELAAAFRAYCRRHEAPAEEAAAIAPATPPTLLEWGGTAPPSGAPGNVLQAWAVQQAGSGVMVFRHRQCGTAFEIVKASNGWFRVLVEGKASVVWMSGRVQDQGLSNSSRECLATLETEPVCSIHEGTTTYGEWTFEVTSERILIFNKQSHLVVNPLPEGVPVMILTDASLEHGAGDCELTSLFERAMPPRPSFVVTLDAAPDGLQGLRLSCTNLAGDCIAVFRVLRESLGSLRRELAARLGLRALQLKLALADGSLLDQERDEEALTQVLEALPEH